MSLKVVTRNLDSKGFENVYIQYAYAGASKRFPVGLKVLAGGMEDGKLVKCAGAAWKEHNASITDGNEAIETRKSDLARLIRRFSEDNGEAPTPAVLEELLKQPKSGAAAGAGAAGAKGTFWQLFNDYHEEYRLKSKRNTGRTLKPLGTLLLDFEKTNGIKLSLASFDFALMTRLNDFMLSQGHVNSTARVRMSMLKSMLNVWVKMGISKHVGFREYKRDKKIKDAPGNQRIVALNEAELTELMGLEVDCPKQRYARALFALACATGLRFSDVKRIGPSNIDGQNIRITPNKTEEEITIPLNWISSQVIAEYPQGMKSVDLGRYNDNIRALGERCPSLHKPFTRVKFSGTTAIIDETKKLKYQHLTSHVARKTFVTRCLIKGIPEYKIRKWTGHKDLKSFSRYVDNEAGEAEAMARF